MNGYNFTEEVRRTLRAAREESVRLRHEYVGTEHLLLALIRERPGVIVEVLPSLGADADAIGRTVEKVILTGKVPPQPPQPHLQPPPHPQPPTELPYTTRAKKVLE